MKKIAIGALAMAASMGSAYAQSNVTIYGRLDASVQYLDRGNGQSLTQLNDGVGATSNIGFRGLEDLGGGLAAIFNLETRIGMDTGAGGAASNSGTNIGQPSSLFSRNAYVGLQGPAGKITFGRNYTAPVTALYNMNAIRVGINTGLAGNVSAQGIGNDFWNNNQIRYDSPEFSGFSVGLNYAFGETAGSNKRGSGYGGAVFYRNGGLAATAGVQSDQQATAGDNNVTWSVATAAYTFGQFKVSAGMDRVHNSSRIAGWVDSKMWTLGGAYSPTPSLTLAAQFFNTRDTLTDTASKQTVLNAYYALSKRTALYALVTHTDNGALAVQPMYLTPGIANATAKGVTAGVLHTF